MASCGLNGRNRLVHGPAEEGSARVGNLSPHHSREAIPKRKGGFRSHEDVRTFFDLGQSQQILHKSVVGQRYFENQRPKGALYCELREMGLG